MTEFADGYYATPSEFLLRSNGGKGAKIGAKGHNRQAFRASSQKNIADSLPVQASPSSVHQQQHLQFKDSAQTNLLILPLPSKLHLQPKAP